MSVGPPQLRQADTPRGKRFWAGYRRALVVGLGALLMLSIVARVTDSPELLSGNTYGAAFRLAVPILLAGLGGLFAERVGVVNIGLEGMMILGTWSSAWAAWQFDSAWIGLLAALVGGALGGLLLAVAAVTFGVDQIVAGVAVNILAAGVARFLSVVLYDSASGGGATQSPRITDSTGSASLPFLAGGEIFGWRTPNLLGWLETADVFFVSDVAALFRGPAETLTWLTAFAVVLVPLSWYVLWRTPLGLRMRSVGEHPVAAESLGVRVYGMKYLGVTISGALAGMGGAVLVIEFAGIYREGQTAGRGFIALAALIFGNWRPTGVAGAAGLFGYADALQLRSESAVHGLLLFVALALVAAAVWAVSRRQLREAVLLALGAAVFVWWYATTETVPRQFIFFTPHLVTLLVLAFAAQRLTPPAAAGRPYRRGVME
jgi:ABC-type uncharacterized transport system permease subunit